MNFLAHAFLARRTDESLLGNLMGDFVKGVLKDQYPPAILEGIRQHRMIDSFADNDPWTLASRNLFSRKRRRYAGIIVDMCYDHFLARHWNRYAVEDLAEFIAQVYGILTRYHGVLPDRMKRTADRMVSENWLGSYEHLEGLDVALNHLGRRLKRTNALPGSAEEIKANYVHLEAHFLNFFPILITFSDELKKSSRLEVF